MANRGLLLIVGNGLSMDLAQQFPLSLSKWPTSSPLKWEVVHPELGRPFAELFPRAFAALGNAPSASSDFERMTRLVAVLDTYSSQEVVELRHFLVMAFSMYQRVVDRLQMDEWRWFRFMQENAPRLGGIVSLNYDLVVERIASMAGVGLGTPALPQPSSSPFDGFRGHKAVIWKPHGSIDYRPDRNAIVMPTTYPISNWFIDPDLPLEWCPKSEWTIPRVSADVVVPTESSRYRHFQWVTPGEQWMRARRGQWDVCVIVGVSYAECDREEIDVALCALPRGAAVFVVDPSPSAALLRRLDELG